MAPHAPPPFERVPPRHDRAARLEGPVAALDEAATRESLRKRRHRAADHGERAAALRRGGERIEKLARVRMGGPGKESVPARGLHDLARIHDGDTMRDL